MTTLFKAPQIGEPRSVGVKNGGVTSYSRRTVAPVTRIVGDAFIPGQQIEWRWRSSSSEYFNPRETKIAVRYKLRFGPETVDPGETEGQLDGLTGEGLPQNVRFRNLSREDLAIFRARRSGKASRTKIWRNFACSCSLRARAPARAAPAEQAFASVRPCPRAC